MSGDNVLLNQWYSWFVYSRQLWNNQRNETNSKNNIVWSSYKHCLFLRRCCGRNELSSAGGMAQYLAPSVLSNFIWGTLCKNHYIWYLVLTLRRVWTMSLGWMEPTHCFSERPYSCDTLIDGASPSSELRWAVLPGRKLWGNYPMAPLLLLAAYCISVQNGRFLKLV